MTRARGFTVVEVLIAVLVASLLTVFVLSLTRSQLVTYEMQGQVTTVQQNARAGFDFLESTLRRSCSGIAWGGVEVAIPPTGTFQTACFNVYDGAAPQGGSFVGGAAGNPAALPDAVEVIYGDGTVYSTVWPSGAGANSVLVADAWGFVANDLVLLGDLRRAWLLRIANIAPAPTAPGQFATITFTASVLNDGYAPLVGGGSMLMRARAISIYVDAATDPNNPLLKIDPDGVTGNSHSDAEPLVDGVEDFQIAVGVDTNNDGQINDSLLPPNPAPDEWLGNGDVANELPLAAPDNTGGTPPTNYWFTTQQPPLPPGAQMLRAIRVSLIVRSHNQYAGTPSQVGPLENRTAWSWPAGNVGPRWRQMRMVVSPRAWNLGD